ncbi:hypothetical protein BJV78DRAFT_1277776 [Lactifluus subvellereus]|nr:hypothetical protein BJV78DRAFT_1277776 [Lactifluus subvellereus]
MPAGGLMATRPRQQALEEHRQHLRASPSLDGSLEAREREDSVGLLSPPYSQPSPRASLLGSRNGSTASLARIGGAFRSRLRSRHTSPGSGSASGGTDTGSGASSRHNPHVSLSNVSRARAQSLIHSIGGASRSSIELVLGTLLDPNIRIRITMRGMAVTHARPLGELQPVVNATTGRPKT